jgi:hypothetical protein
LTLTPHDKLLHRFPTTAASSMLPV